MPRKRSPIQLGKQFGMLTIIREAEDHVTSTSGRRLRRVVCICECGNEHTVILKNLADGSTISCGCFRSEKFIKDHSTHGMTNTSEYRIWRGIKKRCLVNTVTEYNNYGGRGITVCERWKNSFENFYHDMGKRPSTNHSIDRIDNNLGYSKENCQWATMKEQSNNKRNNVILEFNGESMNVTQWAEKLGIDRSRIFNRLNSGWDIEKILTTPVAHKRTHQDRCSIQYEHNGITLTAKEWADTTDVSNSIFYKRLRRGWPIGKAIV